MTSNNGQGAVPSGGCLTWHAVLRGKVSESWNGDWDGCDGEWGRLTRCPECVQTSAWGKPRKRLLDALLPFSGGSGGEGGGYTSPLFWGFWRRRVRENVTWLHGSSRGKKMLVPLWFTLFSSQCLNFLIFPPDAVFPGTSASSVGAESGIIPKQETVTILWNLYTGIPKRLMGGWHLHFAWQTHERIHLTDHECRYVAYAVLCALLGRSVMSNSVWPHGLQPARLLCPRGVPGKSTGEGSHSLIQGIFQTQGSNSGLLHCRQILYCLSPQGSPVVAKSPLAVCCVILPYTNQSGWRGEVFLD